LPKREGAKERHPKLRVERRVPPAGKHNVCGNVAGKELQRLREVERLEEIGKSAIERTNTT